MSIKSVQSLTQYLAGAGVVVGATTITLTSFTDIYGNILTMTDFGTTGYITLEPDSDNEEAASFTGITANAGGTYTLTGIKTILAKSPYTETSGLVRQHSGGTKVVITDNVGFWNTFGNKFNDETITGQWTFTNTPIVPGTVSDASTTVKGVSKLSVAPASAADPIAYGANEPAIAYIPTAGQKAGLAGTQGVISATNKYETEDNVFTLDTDQTQVTQNSSQAVGEAGATTKANYLAQSFTPAKTKIRGVTLYKSADTGTFTGTVTVTLEADIAGSPSGTPLATQTITNADWLTYPVGAFEVDFVAEYASMVQGSLYWIVVKTSTSDNSNHPNIGTNTAGGYANGSVKYKNTTDSWVTIANIDLYFKTLQGVSSQLSYIPASPVVTVINPVSSGDGTTQFSVTNTSGTTFRYTYNGGADPSINATNDPVGSYFQYWNAAGNSGNNGTFLVTASGTNYVEVTNAGGVAENNKVIGDGYINKSIIAGWKKPTGLKYVEVEVQAAGGGGAATNSSGGGGAGGGGYSKKIISASSLPSILYPIAGKAAAGQTYNNAHAGVGGSSYFNSSLYATGGNSVSYSTVAGGTGGTGVGGDINIIGGAGGDGTALTGARSGGEGGGSMFAPTTGKSNGTDHGQFNASGYGGGGSGGAIQSGTQSGGTGSDGIIIIKEFYY